MKNFHGLFLVGCSALALAGCGPTDIASPGTGGNVTINNTTNTPPAPAPTPAPTSTLVQAATECPSIADSQGLTNAGTITGPEGTWRVCRLPARFNESSTLTKAPGVLYEMNGRVQVGTDGGFTRPSSSNGLPADTNVTLSIDPGVIIYSSNSRAWLAVNRGNKINAVGTPTQPIIFTSLQNVRGQNIETSNQQWGGVVLMGRAPVTDCNVIGTSVAAGNCQRRTEGDVDQSQYGGALPTDNSGEMAYVQIRYSGAAIAVDDELQALTTEGTGSETKLSYIQSYNSSDDGVEFFGGVLNMDHLIVVGADDDSLDMDTGVQANLQYVLLIQRDGVGDSLMELDSNSNEADTPRQVSRIANFTAIQRLANPDNERQNQASLFFRGNADIELYNGVVVSPFNECIRMNGSGDTNSATLLARSVVMTCNTAKYLGTGSFNATTVANFFGTGANNNNDGFTSTLTGGFINGANEAAVTPFSIVSLSSFFADRPFIGAVRDSTDTWYAGWTCNSVAANFGPTSGSCLSLPTT